MSKIARWRGLAALVRDAVEHGSRGVLRIQLESADRVFFVLEHVPSIAAPAKIVHAAHDLGVRAVHANIRGVNALVGTLIDAVLEELDSPERPDG